MPRSACASTTTRWSTRSTRCGTDVGRARRGVRPRARRRVPSTSWRPTSATRCFDARVALVGRAGGRRCSSGSTRARDAVVVVGPAASPVGGVLTIAAVRAPGVRARVAALGHDAAHRLRAAHGHEPDRPRRSWASTGPTRCAGDAVEVGRSTADQRTGGDFLADGNDASTFRTRHRQRGAERRGSRSHSLFAIVSAVALARPRVARPRALLPWCAAVLLAYLPIVYLARLFPFHDIGVAALLGCSSCSARSSLGERRTASRRVGRAVDAAIGRARCARGGARRRRRARQPVPVQQRARVLAVGGRPLHRLRQRGVRGAGGGRGAPRRACWRTGSAGGGARGGASAVLVVALLADGAPIWGADVGGVLSMVPAYGVTAALLLGVRVRVRTVVAFVSAALVALAAATVVDLQQASGHRRHLGAPHRADPGRGVLRVHRRRAAQGRPEPGVVHDVELPVPAAGRGRVRGLRAVVAAASARRPAPPHAAVARRARSASRSSRCSATRSTTRAWWCPASCSACSSSSSSRSSSNRAVLPKHPPGSPTGVCR